MNKAILCLVSAVCFAVLVIGCGGGMSSSQTPTATNMTQATLTIHDNPPMSVTVLSFEIEVTGAALQPSDSTKQPVSMLSEPEDIELEHLQTESALLASKSVPTGTYKSLMVSFANPKMTIQNQTGMTLTLGSQMCADKQVCEFDPKLNQSSVTVANRNPRFAYARTVARKVGWAGGVGGQRRAGTKCHGETPRRPGSGARLRRSRCLGITSATIRRKIDWIATAAEVWVCKYYGNTGKRCTQTRLPSAFSKNLTLGSIRGVSRPNSGGTSRSTLIARFTNPRGLGIRMA